jgi:hypothetical protein
VGVMLIHSYQPPYKDYFVAAFQSPLMPFIELEIGQWCYNSFGPSGYRKGTGEVRWRDDIHYGEVTFSREEDLTLFLLKWSS